VRITRRYIKHLKYGSGYPHVLELKKPRPKITPLKIGTAVILVIVFWMVLQIAIQTFMDSLYFKFLLLCFLGFGFLGISYMLKFA
jgi:UDP-N-acetylmuramyl pentapeptide phosphotransferase/UDP-N-acetylglucosamine-1-phosphate transferase